MKKLLIAAVLLAVLPGAAAAQVDKQVEVTKAYVPSVESASKLAVAPDRTDTARMRPEIDYTITPLSLRTTLQTRPIRPATVTYWEFNRPLPFYLKAGAGYPLNSVLDFYASTQNPGTGYVVGYVNHEGRYADIKNDFGVKNNSVRMYNRIGAAAGKYFGRHTLEAELSYDNRLYHRYGSYLQPGIRSAYQPGARVDFGDAVADVRFGDDFRDLSRLNFEVALHGGVYMSSPELAEKNEPEEGDDGYGDFHPAAQPGGGKWHQMTLGASAKIARAFGRHRFTLDAGYEYFAGKKVVSDYTQQQIHAGLRYGIDGGVVRLEAGADYYHDKIDGAKEAENYVIPFVKLDLNLGTAGLRPFAEADGGVYANSPRALSLLNPYVINGLWTDKSSVDYNFRFGVGGNIGNGKFNYRVYAGLSIHDNHLYWYSNDVIADDGAAVFAGEGFYAEMARQTVTSFNGEVEYRPVSVLRLNLGVHGYIYNDETKGLHEILGYSGKVELENGAPRFEGNAGIRYEGRKIAFGVGAVMQSSRCWTAGVVTASAAGGTSSPSDASTRINIFKAPFATDLRVDFDWKLSGRVTLFAEGRNLLNSKIYEFPWHPEYGVNFTVGVKANF